MTQPTLFDGEPQPEPAAPVGWTRIRGGVAALYVHSSGWQVRRCGHPTALWPYYAVPPHAAHLNDPGRNNMLLTGGYGVGIGFQTVAKAKEGAEQEMAGTFDHKTPVDEPKRKRRGK